MTQKSNIERKTEIGSARWNDEMYLKHPTPYRGIAGYIERQRINSILKATRQHLPSTGGTIVELGCEAGNLLATLENSFPKAKFYGLDISEKALQQAKEKLRASVELQQADITQNIQWTAPSPNIIICSETLEHIPDCEAAIQSIYKLAGPDTVLIFTVPLEQLKNQIKSLLRWLGLFNLLFKGIEEGKSEWHVQDFSKEDFINLIGNRFEIIRYKQIWGLHQEIIARKV